MRGTQEVTGRNLPSLGKSGDLDFSPNFIQIYLNKLPASFSAPVKWEKAQWPSSFQNPIPTNGQSSWILEEKLRNWIQTGAELKCLFFQSSSVEMDERHKQSFHAPALSGDYRTEWQRSPPAWNEIFHLLFLWVLFLLHVEIKVSVGRYFWL